ncbi:MAG: glycosyltransferase family 39 protein [Anaerolineae bacterium]|nr:glycosyltransferase family 39 protein [Anaerolineae bacterium]
MTTLSDAQPQPEAWFTRPRVLGLSIAGLLVLLLTFTSAALHFSNLGAIGDSNTYYTAAVESMTQSLHNFFFVAAEPGGSVTVDKPPLGLWIETIFALIFGVSGFSTSLPNMLAGILSVPLLYLLVKKHLGAPAGMAAAMALVVTPVVFAADRNNTADGMLTFTLLLAAWAFIQATERSRLGYLLLGAVLVGLGFNIKMLQAFLPLPAFFALYFLAARSGWARKMLHLALASGVLLAVSLAWALVVDAVPPEARPYIGSSTDNTVIELIVGHNGLNRLLGGRRAANANDALQPPLANDQPGQLPPAPNDGLPPGLAPYGQLPPVFNDMQPPANDLPPSMADGVYGQPPPGNNGQGNEVGERGVLRFFQPPLAKEMSWLLPFALVSLLLLLFSARPRLPVTSGAQQASILWGGWLLTCLVFFSSAAFFHAYYMVMLAPAMAALVGGGVAWFLENRSRWALLLLVGTSLVTLIFQLWLANQFTPNDWWLPVAVAVFVIGCSTSLPALQAKAHRIWRPLAAWSLLLSMLVVPMAWSLLTLQNPNANTSNLPGAYAGDQAHRPPIRQDGGSDDARQRYEDALLTFLEGNTTTTHYLIAVPKAATGVRFVLATGRPVLYMGGFTGSDDVIDADRLQQMVAAGDLRFILISRDRNGGKQQIIRWVAQNCRIVPRFSQLPPQGGSPGLPSGEILYDCASINDAGS